MPAVRLRRQALHFSQIVHCKYKTHTHYFCSIIVMNNNDLWAMYQTMRRLREFTEAMWHPFCAQNGITPLQLSLLYTLASQGPQSAGALAKNAGMAEANCSVMCKKLEGMGLLCRQRGLQDERQVQVRLTPEGMALCRGFCAECGAIYEELQKKATGDELACVGRGIQCLDVILQRGGKMPAQSEERNR